MKKYVVITGASSGIGQSLAVRFARAGQDVIAIGRDQVALQRTKMLANNDKINTVMVDLSEDAQLDEIARFLKPDDKVLYLIHCAATPAPFGALVTLPRSDLIYAINVNVMAPIFLTQKLAAHFDTNSRVLFMGSDYVGTDKKFRPNITSSYSISKSALKIAVEYFRKESSIKGIVGYLNPGATSTSLHDSLRNAVLKHQAFFNVAEPPADPNQVAEFIQSILEKTSDQDFTKTDWDYRNAAHKQFLKLEHPVPMHRAKL